MLELICYIVIFFPFVKLLGINLATGDGIQLYSFFFMMMLSVFICKKKHFKIPKSLAVLYFWIYMSVVISMLFSYPRDGRDIFLVARYVAIYSSVITATYVGYFFIKQNGGIDEKKIKIFINIYFIVGVIQKFVNRNFMYFILANHRTSESRGVISVTSEPSYYAYMCIFFMILALEFKRQKEVYFFNALFQLIFLARSSIGVLYLMIWGMLCVLYCLRYINVKRLCIMSVFSLITIGIVYYLLHSSAFSGQRLVFFLNILLENGSVEEKLDILLSDGSTFIRFTEIQKCIVGFFENLGLPNGLNTEVIQSGYGTFLYPLGIFGGVIIAIIFNIFCKGTKGMNRFVVPIFLTIIMFSLIQISNPLFGYLVALYVWKRKMQNFSRS